MGLTRAQKIRKHGERAADPAPEPGPAPIASGPTLSQRREEMRPAPERSSSPLLIVGVIMVIGVLFMLYVHLIVLTGFSAQMAGGYGVPELRFGGFTAPWLQGFAEALGDDGAAAYRSLHWSTGLLAPLFMAAGWALFVVLQSRGGQRLFRWVGLAVVLAFLAICLGGNAALDQAVAAPHDEALVTLASLLVSMRLAAFLAMLALLVWAMFASVRRIAGEMAERGAAEDDEPRSTAG